ncbi:unnamed protein product [Zymoseptoria tritici ST99CH_3D1]|nr:unnamed protein product [Zymoseptoria tritici ST99CH_3D1]
MLFFSFFKTLVNHEVTVELKNDISIRGTLKSVDQFLNIKLDNISVVDEVKFPHLVSLAVFLEKKKWNKAKEEGHELAREEYFGKRVYRVLTCGNDAELGQECVYSGKCGEICALACGSSGYTFVGGCDEERGITDCGEGKGELSGRRDMRDRKGSARHTHGVAWESREFRSPSTK